MQILLTLQGTMLTLIRKEYGFRENTEHLVLVEQARHKIILDTPGDNQWNARMLELISSMVRTN